RFANEDRVIDRRECRIVRSGIGHVDRTPKLATLGLTQSHLPEKLFLKNTFVKRIGKRFQRFLLRLANLLGLEQRQRALVKRIQEQPSPLDVDRSNAEIRREGIDVPRWFRWRLILRCLGGAGLLTTDRRCGKYDEQPRSP